MTMTLPDCMMPDGAVPCLGFKETHAALAEARAEIDSLKIQVEDYNDEAFAAINPANALSSAERLACYEKTLRLLASKDAPDWIEPFLLKQTALKAEVKRLREALEWYAERAAALASEKAGALDYTMAIVAELSIDGGRHASAAGNAGDEAMSKPILCLDFDGVLHSYASGWKGAGIIPDPPVPGAIDFLREAVKHFRVAIFSSRSHQPGGLEAMQNWLIYHSEIGFRDAIFPEIEWPTEKPAAFITLDDRAITFTGEWPSIDSLLAFKPWNKP